MSKRLTIVLAHVIESIDLALEIEERHFHVLDSHHLRGARWNIRKLRHLDEIRHTVILYSGKRDCKAGLWLEPSVTTAVEVI